jgi:hypothetical protein
MEKVKSRNRAYLIEENLEGCMEITTKTLNLILKVKAG